MFLLGFDIGSSSVKVSLVNGENGNCVASSFHPKEEMKITAHQAGWAEQEPGLWWKNLKLALSRCTKRIKSESGRASNPLVFHTRCMDW
jgi:xylulokinase